MDNLTHGLLGLSIGALRRPDRAPGQGTSPTDRATLLGCVLAAELPDVDSLWMLTDEVHHALHVHRGITHSLFAAPVVAAVAAAAACLVFRGARLRPVFAFSLVSVLIAHLLADLWTGWGTRILYPLDAARYSLDWTLVVDPLLTLPLLAGAVVAWRRRALWRRALVAGLAVSSLYLGGRVASQGWLHGQVARAHPEAEAIRVFPSWLGLRTWRYVATYPDEHVAGLVRWPREVLAQGRHRRPGPDALPGALLEEPTVREAVAWARFPLIETADDGPRSVIRVADLRYHLAGEPTLAFVLRVDEGGRVVAARLERGGTATELMERWRDDG
jgi:inner membrane protein